MIKKKKMFLHADDDSGAPSNILGVLAGPGAIRVDIGSLPRLEVKGHKKKKRLKRGMNAEAKRKHEVWD